MRKKINQKMNKRKANSPLINPKSKKPRKKKRRIVEMRNWRDYMEEMIIKLRP